jgi:hypothetical protein
MAYVKDSERTKTDFSTYDLAAIAAKEIKAQLKDPKEESFRVRIRPRSRTGMWDVVVKVKREEKKA